METGFVYLVGTNKVINSGITWHSRLFGDNGCLKYRLLTVFKTQVARSAMKSYRLSELSHAEVHGLKARPRIDFSSIFSTVKPIVDDVHCKGDAAVIEFVFFTLLPSIAL